MKVAIITNFMEFRAGYSLTGIVKDQIQMLTEYGHEVHLFVNSQYHGEPFDPRVTLNKCIPFCHLVDFASFQQYQEAQYEGHRKIASETAEVLKKELEGFDVAFTHDFIFIGWFLPYGQGCKEAGKHLKNLRWLHWIHSVPTGKRDYWSIGDFGPKHKIVYPNKSDMVRVAEEFKGKVNDVRVIPHIKDLRTWFDWDQESCEFVKEYPMLMQADIVQVYPASVDRLESKRVKEVILIFSKLKKMGHSVCLVIANQWATTVKHKQSVDQYKKIGARNGLEVGTELVFTSDWKVTMKNNVPVGKYEVGLPKKILRDLMTCMNLFIFPTREESFGLVLPEVVLSSGCFCVLNKSLQQQLEISGFTALYFDFGSFHMNHMVDNEEKYFHDIAYVTIGQMRQNESLMTRTFMRKMYNWDHLYNRYYGPIMASAEGWG